MHYHVSAKHWWSVPRFEAQPSQLASHDATWARVRERTPSLASRGGPHDSVSPPTRRRDARGRDARQDSRRAAPAGRHLAPRARWRRTPQAQGAVRRPASRVGLHHERHREVQAHPRAGRGTRPARSRRIPFARRVPHSPCPPLSSRGSRPNRFCLGSRPRDAHFEIPPTTVTTPPSSRRPRSSSSSPRTSPRHAPPSPVRAPGASPSAPVPVTPTACSTRRTSKAQTRRAA